MFYPYDDYQQVVNEEYEPWLEDYDDEEYDDKDDEENY
jgi:hypothetical protein